MYKNRFFQYLCTDLYAVKRNSETNIQRDSYLIIQQENFFHFIKIRLQIEFRNSKVWFQTSILEWMVYPKNLCFEVPTHNYTELIRHNKTYSTCLFLLMLVYDIQNQKIYFEWRSFRDLPVLTQQGHFMVNGSFRVCITQIIRGSGVYRSRELNSSKKIIFYIDFVPKQGRWVRLEKDFKNFIWFCIQKEFCIRIAWMVNKINCNTCFSRMIKKNIIRKKTERKFINLISQIKRCKKVPDGIRWFSISVSNYLEDQQIEILYLIQKFSNFQIYDIGDLRRKYINERFNQRIPISLRCIIPTDFIRAIFELNILINKQTIKRFDDLDNLRIRRLYRMGYLLQRELKQEIFKLNWKMCQQCMLPLNYHKQNIIQFISFILFDHRIHRFITINPLFHFADHINPLTNITQKRRLTGIGIGSLNVPIRNEKVRDIHPSHFGRLCLFETPDGKNAGLVIFLTIMRRLNDNNLVQFMICDKQKDYLQNVFERRKLKPLVSIWKFPKDKDWVAQFSVDILGKFESNLEMVIDDRYLTYNFYIKMISFITTQMFALSPNLIPFLQNNDANRVLMGANMIRQSLSTMKFLSSRISSGVDIFIINDMGQNLYVCCPGIVVVRAIVSLHFLFLKEYAKTYYIVKISLLQKYVKSENKIV